MNDAKNITQAVRLANCNTRALQILEEGYTFFPMPENDAVAVIKPGNLHASYFIDTYGNACDCLDFQKHEDTCKHLIAWNILRAEEAEMDRRAELEANAECATGCDPYYSRF